MNGNRLPFGETRTYPLGIGLLPLRKSVIGRFADRGRTELHPVETLNQVRDPEEYPSSTSVRVVG